MKVANETDNPYFDDSKTLPLPKGVPLQGSSSSEYFYTPEQKDKIQVGSLENGQVTKFEFEKVLKIQSALSFTICISIFLIVAAMQIEYSQTGSQYDSLIIFCLTFNCANTIIAIIISVIRFMAMLNLQKNRKDVYQNASLFTTKRIISVLIECAIILIQPYPFLNDLYFETQNSFQKVNLLYPINDLLAIMSLGRTYIIFRGLLLLTPYMNNRSNRLCKMYGCRANFSFSLKCLFKDNPLLLILVLFTASSIIFSYAVYLAQRNLTQQSLCDIDVACSFSNSLWLILMTITTVGYGDYFPQTPLGRFIIFFVAIWGTFIVSIMVVVVSNTLKMQKKQKEASIVIRKLAIREQVKQVAAKFMGYTIIMMMARKKGDQQKAVKYEIKGKRVQNQFALLRRQLKCIRNDNDLYDELASKFLNLNNDIDILNSNQVNIINFIHDKLEYHETTKQAIFNDFNNFHNFK